MSRHAEEIKVEMKQQKEPFENKVNRNRVLNAKPAARTENRVLV